MTYFRDQRHLNDYQTAMEIANTGRNSNTAQSVLYLLTSVSSVASNLSDFFNIEGMYINPVESALERLSKGERCIVALAFNLYNGFRMEDIELSPYDVLVTLDESFKLIYMNAIQIKMGMSDRVEKSNIA